MSGKLIRDPRSEMIPTRTKQFVGPCVRCGEPVFRNEITFGIFILCDKCLARNAAIKIDEDMWNYLMNSQKEAEKK